AQRVTHPDVRLVLRVPAPGVRNGAMPLDPLGLERRAHRGRGAVERQDQGDEALAAPGIVAGEIRVVRAGCCDEALKPARPELRPGAVEAAGEDFGGEGGLLSNAEVGRRNAEQPFEHPVPRSELDRKSTRLNSSHVEISYAVFCLKKKKKKKIKLREKVWTWRWAR